jgi:hypothetical protein
MHLSFMMESRDLSLSKQFNINALATNNGPRLKGDEAALLSEATHANPAKVYNTTVTPVFL